MILIHKSIDVKSNYTEMKTCELDYKASSDTDNNPRWLTSRYDTRCYINVRSKANISQLNLPHGTDD